jgi:hypothetical protein
MERRASPPVEALSLEDDVRDACRSIVTYLEGCSWTF